MNEFLPRSEPVSAAANAIDRGGVPGVRGVTTATAAGSATVEDARIQDRKVTDLATATWRSRENSDQGAAVADMARVQARIANVIANLQSDTSPGAVTDAQDHIMALLPQPVVVLPMPPASPETIRFAEMIASKMIEQAAQARLAQASARPAVVDQLVNAQGISG